LRSSLARSVRGAALFEVGRVFESVPGTGGAVGDEGPVREGESIAFALGGASLPAFPGEDRDLDFFDAKGALEQLFAVVGVHDWHLGGPGPPPLHPGRSAVVEIDGRAAGLVGELHPRWADREDL